MIEGIDIKYNFIAIEGNIGAGKTTLAKRLSDEFDAKLITERFEDNSFLPKFYEQPDMYAFPLEMSFLADRYQQLKEQLTSQDLFKRFTVSDYFIDKSLIFARNNLKPDEFNLYSRLFYIISDFLPKPDLLIYLFMNVTALQSNIRNRGRSYEQSIQDSYLQRIQDGYFNHFRSLKGFPILILDTNEADFMYNDRDYRAFLDLLNFKFEAGLHRLVI